MFLNATGQVPAMSLLMPTVFVPMHQANSIGDGIAEKIIDQLGSLGNQVGEAQFVMGRATGRSYTRSAHDMLVLKVGRFAVGPNATSTYFKGKITKSDDFDFLKSILTDDQSVVVEHFTARHPDILRSILDARKIDLLETALCRATNNEGMISGLNFRQMLIGMAAACGLFKSEPLNIEGKYEANGVDIRDRHEHFLRVTAGNIGFPVERTAYTAKGIRSLGNRVIEDLRRMEREYKRGEKMDLSAERIETLAEARARRTREPYRIVNVSAEAID